MDLPCLEIYSCLLETRSNGKFSRSEVFVGLFSSCLSVSSLPPSSLLSLVTSRNANMYISYHIIRRISYVGYLLKVFVSSSRGSYLCFFRPCFQPLPHFLSGLTEDDDDVTDCGCTECPCPPDDDGTDCGCVECPCPPDDDPNDDDGSPGKQWRRVTGTRKSIPVCG